MGCRHSVLPMLLPVHEYKSRTNPLILLHIDPPHHGKVFLVLLPTALMLLLVVDELAAYYSYWELHCTLNTSLKEMSESEISATSTLDTQNVAVTSSEVQEESTDNSKRKRDEITNGDVREAADHENGEAEKKSKLSDSTPEVTNTFVAPGNVFSFGSTDVVEKMEVSPEKVGQIIGSRGAVIQEMQTRSGCKIHVNQDFPPGVNREVTFTGTASQIATARSLIAMVLEQGPTAIHMLNGPVVTQELECPQSLVGRIIGASGATVRDIQARCSVRVQIDQDFPEGVPRKITITGNESAVQQAVAMVKFVMENGPPGGCMSV